MNFHNSLVSIHVHACIATPLSSSSSPLQSVRTMHVKLNVLSRRIKSQLLSPNVKRPISMSGGFPLATEASGPNLGRPFTPILANSRVASNSAVVLSAITCLIRCSRRESFLCKFIALPTRSHAWMGVTPEGRGLTLFSVNMAFLQRCRPAMMRTSLRTPWSCCKYSTTLEAKKKAALLGGGEKRLEKQHKTVEFCCCIFI